MQGVLAGLDVGTTWTKAVLLTPEGQEVAHGRAPTRWTVTAAGTQTTAASLVDSARTALRRALEAVPAPRVLGLGVASMGESGILLGRDGDPLGPVIAWHDARDADDCDDLRRTVGPESFSRTTGLPLGTQWSLTKHRWLSRNAPSTGAAVRRLNIAEWIVRSYGGEEASEQSLASRTGWLALQARTWWAPALEWSGARAGLMADLVAAGTPLGRADGSAGLDPLRGAVLTVAGYDHQAAAVGARAAGPGDEFDSCGTAEALVRTVPAGLSDATVLRLTREGITVGWHPLAGHWSLLGATQAGLVLARLMGLLGITDAGLADLDTRAAAATPGQARVDLDDADVIRILDHGDGDADVWRAGVEAVTAQAARLHAAMSTATGPRRDLTVAGGWSRSSALMAAKAALLGPVTQAGSAEAGARGAALLAGLAAGVYASVEDFPAPPGIRATTGMAWGRVPPSEEIRQQEGCAL